MLCSASSIEDAEQSVGHIADKINTIHLDGYDIVSAQLNGHYVYRRTRIGVNHEQRLNRIISNQSLYLKSHGVVTPQTLDFAGFRIIEVH